LLDTQGGLHQSDWGGLSFPLQDIEATLGPDKPAELVTIHGSRKEATR
jgi:hypothetical protein